MARTMTRRYQPAGRVYYSGRFRCLAGRLNKRDREGGAGRTLQYVRGNIKSLHITCLVLYIILLMEHLMLDMLCNFRCCKQRVKYLQFVTVRGSQDKIFQSIGTTM